MKKWRESKRYSAARFRGGGLRSSAARRRGAAQAVVDRLAEPGLRDRHHRDGVGLPVEFAQRGEEVGRRLGQVARCAEIAERDGRVGAVAAAPARRRATLRPAATSVASRRRLAAGA